MYKSQPTYDGITNTDFILPGGASYNDPGSGNGSDYVTGSGSSRKSRSKSLGGGSSSSYTTNYGYSYEETPRRSTQTYTQPTVPRSSGVTTYRSEQRTYERTTPTQNTTTVGERGTTGATTEK